MGKNLEASNALELAHQAPTSEHFADGHDQLVVLLPWTSTCASGGFLDAGPENRDGRFVTTH
jgi:hypothetical protein